MSIIASSLPLTDPGGTRHMAAETHPGMAHFAGTGPAGMTCRQCTHWCVGAVDYYASGGKHGGVVKPRACAAYTRFTMGRDGNKIPHDACACKHFALNESAPSLRKS